MTFVGSRADASSRPHSAVTSERNGSCPSIASASWRVYTAPQGSALADVLRSLEPSGSRVVVDLTRLSASKDPDAGRVAAFVHDIRARRGDLSDVITLRSGDLDSLAGTVGLPGEALLERIPEALRSRGPSGDRRSSSR